MAHPAPSRARPDALERLLAELRDRVEGAGGDGKLDVQGTLAALNRLGSLVSLLRQTALHSFGEFERRIEELSFLRSTGELFASVFDRDRLCHSLLGLVGRLLGSSHAFLHLFDETGGELALVASQGPPLEAVDRGLALRVARLAALRNEPLVVPDLSRCDELLAVGERAGLRAFLACRVVSQEETLGVISLAEPTPVDPGKDAQNVLPTVCDLAAVALRHAALCEEHLRHQRNLESLVEQRTREVGEIRAALSRQEQIAATGRLAASIAHEINNPMSFLISNLERAREYTGTLETAVPPLLDLARSARAIGDPRGPELAELRELAHRTVDAESQSRIRELLGDFTDVIDEACEAIERIRHVGEDLRSFAHGASGVAEPLDVNRLVETSLHIVRAEAKERVRLEADLGVLPKLRGHRYQLIQVLVNLLKNAVESIDGTGEARVATRVVGRFVEIEVADEGPGVPADAVERIFEPFYTTKEAGSGLGLSVSRSIATAHGGHLEARSSPEGGVFVLRLPVRRAGGG